MALRPSADAERRRGDALKTRLGTPRSALSSSSPPAPFFCDAPRLTRKRSSLSVPPPPPPGIPHGPSPSPEVSFAASPPHGALQHPKHPPHRGSITSAASASVRLPRARPLSSHHRSPSASSLGASSIGGKGGGRPSSAHLHPPMKAPIGDPSWYAVMGGSGPVVMTLEPKEVKDSEPAAGEESLGGAPPSPRSGADVPAEGGGGGDGEDAGEGEGDEAEGEEDEASPDKAEAERLYWDPYADDGDADAIPLEEGPPPPPGHSVHEAGGSIFGIAAPAAGAGEGEKRFDVYEATAEEFRAARVSVVRLERARARAGVSFSFCACARRV